MLRRQASTLADVGAVRGVSHQWAQQLIAEAEQTEAIALPVVVEAPSNPLIGCVIACT